MKPTTAADEIVVVDTGCVDDTVAIAERFATDRGDRKKLRVTPFEWGDRFDEARNFADSLARGRWILHLDADERLVGGAWLRTGLRTMSHHRMVLIPSLEVDDAGEVLEGNDNVAVRADVLSECPWTQWVYERRLQPSPHCVWLTPSTRCCCVHLRRVLRASSQERNLEIAKRWAEAEGVPDAVWAWHNAARRLGRFEEAERVAREYPSILGALYARLP